jgi:4-diphosphocytidyl-2-C-methyl-D-erythritol kinase
MRTSSSTTVAIRSFAKINLGLYIGAARADGFHELRTVYQTIALHDVIRVSVDRSVERKSGSGGGIEILCEDERVPLGSSNTCYRMAERVMAELGASGRVRIEIDKRLPVQGGLGAASSNAVATMVGLERGLGRFRPERRPQPRVPQGLKPSSLEGLNGTAKAVPQPETGYGGGEKARTISAPQTAYGKTENAGTLSAGVRLRMAAEIGSDLPLFLVGGTVLGVGRGEEVYPLADLPQIPMVIVTPEIGVSTPRAFADWDELTKGGAGLRSTGRPGAAIPARVRRGAASATPAQLTPPGASDRLFEVGCALSAWLTDSGSVFGYPNTGASAKGGSRAGKLLSDLVRTGIENDFERVVFPQYPELRDIKGELERAGSRYASLSGSGSTLYGLFRSPAEAAKAASRLRKQGLKAVATSTLTRQKYWESVVVGR